MIAPAQLPPVPVPKRQHPPAVCKPDRQRVTVCRAISVAPLSRTSWLIRHRPRVATARTCSAYCHDFVMPGDPSVQFRCAAHQGVRRLYLPAATCPRR